MLCLLLGVLGKDGNLLYMLVMLFSSFTSKMLVLFVLMAEGWLRDSGSLNFFGTESGLRFIERLCCECSTMTRLKRLHNKYR